MKGAPGRSPVPDLFGDPLPPRYHDPMTLFAGTLTTAGIAAAFVATLINQDSTGLYIICAVIAAAGLLLMLLQVARTRRDAAPRYAWYALAPMAIVVALLGIAASGATCGVACIAWGTPAAAATLAAPDIRGWFGKRRPLRSP